MSFATSITVTVPGDGSVASGGATAPYDLRGAINTLNVSPGIHSIDFNPSAGSTITLNAMLPVLNLVTPNNLTIGNSMGGSITINGNSTWRGFIVRHGTLTLQNMVIQNVTAVGGQGGGGGMGAGAGLFVAGDPVNPTEVVLSNVQINTATVTGGSGVIPFFGGGGGLGIGSAATNTSNAGPGGGGAGGLGGVGGDSASNGGGGGGGINCGASHTGLGGEGGGVAGAQGGGIGGSAAGAGGGGGGAGGAMGGGGGGAAAFSDQGGGGGGDGGVAGGPGGGAGGFGGGGGTGTGNSNGGAGGYFGGGGAGLVPGNGGFGGGGGASGANGGNGGFGGGGGGAVTGGTGGVGGGDGASGSFNGGGGAGFGGAIFVAKDSGTTFTINGAFSTNGNNTATAGSGGAGAFPGWAAGNDFFLMSGTTTLFDPLGDTITISSSIADDSAASFAGVPAGTQAGSAAGAAITIGTSVGGLVTYTGANTYSGGTTINSGTLALSGSGGIASAGAVAVNNNGTVFDISGKSAGGMDIGDLSGTGNSFVTLGSKSLTLGTANNTTYEGVIQGTGGNITKQGTGVFTLTGANTYSGETTLVDGTLALSGGGEISGTSPLVMLNPSIFDISQISTPSTFINSLLGFFGTSINLGSKNLNLVITGASSYGGVIQDGGIGGGSGGSITKFGSGVLTLSGTANTYSGPTNIIFGTIALASIDSLSPNSAVAMGTTVGATLNLAGFNQTIPSLAGGNATGGNVLLGSATLTLTGTSNTTYSGVISGTGALHKTGSSVFTLAGVNTYSGATTIDTGTLALSLNGSLSSSGAVVLNNTSVLDASQLTTSGTIGSLSGDIGTSVNLGSKNLTLGNGNPTTFNGVIADGGIAGGTGGSITKNGTGIFTLTNANTYTGGTTINAGIVFLSNLGALDSNGSVTVNAGTFDISGINPATGEQIGDLSGAAGSFVALGAKTLTFGTANSTTYAGSIQSGGLGGGSPGNLVKQGAGKLNLTGTNTYGGTTNITAGNLAINGPLTSSTVTVGSSGTLSGASTITGDVINNGTISPGNSIGTLNIIGNYTQASGSTYVVEVNTTAADLIAVTGTATIQANTTLSLLPSAGAYPLSNSYIILSSSGLTGTYTNVSNSSPIFKFGVRYDAFNVYLDVFVSQFATISTCGGNIGQVALYLDSLSPTPGSDLAFAIDLLRSFDNVTQINNGLAQLSPAPYKNFILAQEENVISVSRGISDHLNTLINTNCRREVDRKERWEVWSDVFGDWAQMGNSSSGHCTEDEFLGYHATGGGALIGADYSFNNQCVLGITGAYSYSDVHVNESRAKGHINSYYGALYAIIHSRQIFFDLALIGGYDQFHASRKIEYGTLNRNAHTNHGGWDLDGHMDGGFIIGTTTEIRPFFAVDYLYVHENGFQESGADSLNLSVSATNNMLLRSEAGFNFSRCFRVSHGKWIPQVRLSAVHEAFNLNGDSSLGSNGDSYQSHFSGESGSFTVKNQNTNRTLFSPGVGISGVFFDDTMLFSLDYFGEFSGNYSNQVVKGEFSWLF